MNSVREVERRIQQKKSSDLSKLKLPPVPVGVPDNFEDHLKLMFELMALAYQADLTRITSFMMAKEVSMRTYNNLGISEAFHPLSHHQNHPAKMDKLARIQTYHSKIFAEFVKRLAEMPDGDGSMLDHSILLYGSNMSNSNLHNNAPLPSSVFGRAYGKIKGGAASALSGQYAARQSASHASQSRWNPDRDLRGQHRDVHGGLM